MALGSVGSVGPVGSVGGGPVAGGSVVGGAGVDAEGSIGAGGSGAAEMLLPEAGSVAPADAAYHLLELARVPPSVWTVRSHVRDWHSCCTATAGAAGFPLRSLSTSMPCPMWVQVERCLFYPLYFVSFSFLPFLLPALPVCRAFTSFPRLKHLVGLMALQVLLMRLQFRWWVIFLRPFVRRLQTPPLPPPPAVAASDRSSSASALAESAESVKSAAGAATAGAERAAGGAFAFVGAGAAASSGLAPVPPRQKCVRFTLEELFELDRMNAHYFSTRWILPRSIVSQGERLPPAILCLVPHGVLPLGVSAALNRVLGGRTVRFAAAPVLFKVWGIQKFLLKLGTYPAGKRGIHECLSAGDHAGLLLDGIPGMFHGTKANGDEEIFLLQRKAICAIALQAGCPIIPAYCFGHNELWRVVDPLGGLLRSMSKRLDISLTPFFGRGWLPFGPPARRPLLLCFGDPIPCERHSDLPISRVQVDAKHQELTEAYQQIFDTHKAAYGRPDARLTFV